MRGRWIVALGAMTCGIAALAPAPASAVLATPGGCPGVDFQYTSEFAFPPAPEGFADDCHSSLGTVGVDARTGAADIGVPVDAAVTVDPQGRLTHLGSVATPPFFDLTQPTGFIASVTDPAGQSTFHYDGAGRLTGITGPNPSTISYDATGRVSRLDFAGGGFETLGFDPQTGKLTSFGDQGGDSGTFFYDPTGRLRESDTTITALDPIDTFNFDAGGALTSWSHKTQPVSPANVHTFTLNADGDVASTAINATPELTLNYASPHVLSRVATAMPTTIASFTYDATGRLIMAHGQGNSSQTFGYDAAGRVATVTDQNSRMLVFGYDLIGRVNYITDPQGHRTTVSYLPGPDTITDFPSNVGGTSATINGRVLPRVAPATTYAFQYGTTTAYGKTAGGGSLPGGMPPSPWRPV